MVSEGRGYFLSPALWATVWCSMPLGLRPIYDFVDLDYTAQVKKIKPEMYVVFNRAREKFIVYDVDTHMNKYVVLICQEENGAFRPFDGRALETLRKNHQRGPDVSKILGELEAIEKKRLYRHAWEDEDIQYGFATDFKWAGVDVVGSVTSRERTWRR